MDGGFSADDSLGFFRVSGESQRSSSPVAVERGGRRGWAGRLDFILRHKSFVVNVNPQSATPIRQSSAPLLLRCRVTEHLFTGRAHIADNPPKVGGDFVDRNPALFQNYVMHAASRRVLIPLLETYRAHRKLQNESFNQRKCVQDN